MVKDDDMEDNKKDNKKDNQKDDKKDNKKTEKIKDNKKIEKIVKVKYDKNGRKRLIGYGKGTPGVKRPERESEKTKHIRRLAARNPELTVREIGKIADCDHSNVVRVLRGYHIDKHQLDDYKSHRADIFAGLQSRILSSITESDLQKASAGTKITMVGILYDKERLERGQSSINMDIVSRAILNIDSKLASSLDNTVNGNNQLPKATIVDDK